MPLSQKRPPLRAAEPTHRGRNRELESGCQILLVALAAVALSAGVSPVIDLIAAALEPSASAVSTGGILACNTCGVVEDVHEVQRAPARHQGSTVSGGAVESIAVFLGVLSGKPMPNGPSTLYETGVRLQDGSVRVLQSSTSPSWKPGDHVKVVRGRVQPAL